MTASERIREARSNETRVVYTEWERDFLVERGYELVASCIGYMTRHYVLSEAK